jgi:biopolymer transport protein ExbD
MITRPLDLASKLRPEPRNFDWLFLVNGGLVVLFFTLNASQYVLTPGMDFELPVAVGANANAQPATHYLTITSAGMISVRAGILSRAQLQEWLIKQAKTEKRPTLRVYADANVSMKMIAEIHDAAMAAGFVDFNVAAVEPAAPAVRGGK